jgi:hypothetical protein
MYQASVPVFIRMMNNLIGILEKAAAYAEARKIDSAVLINSRLYPDMFPLSRQIQIVTDTAKGCVARLAGMEPPVYEDKETTFAELMERVRKTIAYVSGFKPEQIDGSEKAKIELKVRDGTLTLDGLTFLLNRVLPNFYFHITTTYGILRHNGLEIGKKDYLGKF